MSILSEVKLRWLLNNQDGYRNPFPMQWNGMKERSLKYFENQETKEFVSIENCCLLSSFKHFWQRPILITCVTMLPKRRRCSLSNSDYRSFVRVFNAMQEPQVGLLLASESKKWIKEESNFRISRLKEEKPFPFAWEEKWRQSWIKRHPKEID